MSPPTWNVGLAKSSRFSRKSGDCALPAASPCKLGDPQVVVYYNLRHCANGVVE